MPVIFLIRGDPREITWCHELGCNYLDEISSRHQATGDVCFAPYGYRSCGKVSRRRAA